MDVAAPLATVRPASEPVPPVTRPSQGDWAICCSGGGIRSATYCLGGLQSLYRGGLFSQARCIVGVSGGSYIAAAMALVLYGAGHPVAGEAPPYGPGTPEEQHLRHNTHYIAPDAKTVLVGVMALLFGAAVTLILVMAPLYAFSHAWGWLLRWQGVLTWPGAKVSVTAWSWWLAPVIVAAIIPCLFAAWWVSLSSGAVTRGARRARLVGWAAAVSAGLALAMFAAPLVIAWLYHSTGAIGTIARFFGFGGTGSWSPAALAGVVAAMVTVARASRSKLANLSAQPQSAPAAPNTPAAPSTLQKVAGWAAGQLMPWLASAIVVAIGVFAVLVWMGTAARSGFSAGQLIPVAVALLIMAGTRAVADINRLSMHDFYRWRLCVGYAVTRAAATARHPAQRGRLLAEAASTRLSQLRPGRPGEPAGPDLVICTTANINADRDTPVGQGGFCLAFDPYSVTLRGSPESPQECTTARMTDYEHLIGHTRLTLFDLVAISGAAFSPLMGSMTKEAYRILLTATNMRLGVWLPHPRVVCLARDYLDGRCGPDTGDAWWARQIWLLVLWYVLPHPRWDRHPEKAKRREARLWAKVLQARMASAEERRPAARIGAAVRWRAMQPTLGMLWAEAAGHTSYRATWINVTDGGHYDNLGLVEALNRDAGHVMVMDASGDQADTWFTLGGSMALAGVDAAVDVDLDPSTMVSGPSLASGEVVRPWAHGRFSRTGPAANGVPRDGSIWVCKLGWWRQAPWDIRAYARNHSSYPCETTLQQLYDGAEFEAYRKLGYCAVELAMTVGDLPWARRPRSI